jgi:hypothetical protein
MDVPQRYARVLRGAGETPAVPPAPSNLVACLWRKPAIDTGPSEQRKQKLALEPGGVIGHLDSRAVEAGNGSDQTEAQPIAGRAATAFQPVKALENLLTFVDGDSRAIVGNRNDGIAIRLNDLHRHPAGIAAVLDRIINEVGHSIE